MGFVRYEYCKLRESIIRATNLEDIICLCETFLRKDGKIVIPGYKWFGRNRIRNNISKRAVRGSSGVGILVKDSIFSFFSVDIVD